MVVTSIKSNANNGGSLDFPTLNISHSIVVGATLFIWIPVNDSECHPYVPSG